MLSKITRRFKEFISREFKKDPKFSFGIFLVILFTIFFRFYNWADRIYVHSDHSLFAQAARYAADHLLLPQIGPFSQSTFFTGPWWLWTLELTYLVPFGFLSPWFFMSLISVIFVGLIFWVGKEIDGKWF